VVVVVRAQLEAPLLIPMLALVVTELHLLFLVHPQLMRVEVVVRLKVLLALEGLVEPAVVAMVRKPLLLLHPQVAQLTQAVVVVAAAQPTVRLAVPAS
jgi:hypothetical protein